MLCSSCADGGFADIGEHNEDVVCPLCELYDVVGRAVGMPQEEGMLHFTVRES